MSSDTLVVNLFAGPGTGKSTTAAGVFSRLKEAGVSAELVHEFAKDLVWEERHMALGFQPYIFGKQSYHIHRLLGQVDVIITDAPVILSSHIYGDGSSYADQPFKEFAMETFKKWNTYNMILVRNLKLHPFVGKGRLQNQEQAEDIDRRISRMLCDNQVDHEAMLLDEHVVDNLTEYVKTHLEVFA